MSISRQEEIISALWFIVGTLFFIAGFKSLAVVFCVKALLDLLCAFWYGYKEAKV